MYVSSRTKKKVKIQENKTPLYCLEMTIINITPFLLFF